jgi:hypothetical protein
MSSSREIADVVIGASKTGDGRAFLQALNGIERDLWHEGGHERVALAYGAALVLLMHRMHDEQVTA